MRFDIPDRGPAATSQARPIHQAPAVQAKARRSHRLRFPQMTTTNIVLTVCIISVVVLGVLSGFLYMQNHKLKKDVQSKDGKVVVDETIKAVSKLYALPKDEKPTIVAVNDAAKVKSQEFFKDAKDGDRVLVFREAKFALLYRPSTNKIINTGPVQTQDDANANGSQNGTTSTGTSGATATPGNQ